jgi:molecular chaperone DnaK
MVDEAAANADADKKKRELVEAKNQAETAVFSIEKSLKEHGDKISADDKKAIEDAKDALAAELKNENATVESWKEKTDSLTEKAMKLGEAVYKAATHEQQANAGADASNGGDNNTTDADFSEKK